ncbi:MAG: IPT/TIG domain-containing protein, partial [Proteobacteria bacterium]|nr:IPT/TIG domain-containing protein [Pseudomonadota bacterium]
MKLKQDTSPYFGRIFSQLIVGCLVSIAVAACSDDKRIDTNGAAAKLGNVVSLSSISGTSGPKAGGGKLSLVGQGFMPGAKVLMGTNECTDVSVVSTGASASCTIPAGELGRVSVSLTNPDAQSAHLADAYEYRLAPKISAISPNIIPAAGGSTLTISGENFDSDAKVIIGQASCSPVVVSSASSLSCTSLPMTAGTYGVTVSNHDEQSVKLDNILSIVPALAPTLSTVAPSYGPIAGGTDMTISGANFISGAVVTVGGSICAKTSFVSAQSLVCTTPAGATGYKDVVVSNPDLQTGTLAKAFAFSNGSAPLVASVSPIYALAAGGTVISISGAGFLKGATITVGNAGCGSVVFDSQSSLTCTLGASSAGIKDLKVTNPDGQLATLSNGFTYSTGLPPSVSSILPNYGPLSGGTTVVISGSGIMMGASVSIGGVACTSVNFISSSSLSCSTGVGTYGAKNVVITNPDTLVGTLTNSFTYSNGLAPTVASIAPN